MQTIQALSQLSARAPWLSLQRRCNDQEPLQLVHQTAQQDDASCLIHHAELDFGMQVVVVALEVEARVVVQAHR